MIPLFKVTTSVDLAATKVREVLHSGYIGEGAVVEEFQKALEQEWQSERPVLAVNSCTSAIELALHMCGARGKLVITTPQTCTATNTAIVSRGAEIVWADVDQFSGNISIDSVIDRIKMHGRENIAAIVCVDWGGSPVDYDRLRAHADGIPIIEDAAHAYLTKYNGKYVATSGGDYVCYSFQAIKHLTTVDGGALVVPRGSEKRAELLKWYGLDRKSGASFRCAQTIQEAGYKFQMNNVSAAIGLTNMGHARMAVASSIGCARRYSKELKMGKKVTYVPTFDPDSSYWIYTILVEDRDAFIAYLNKNGVDASPVHARNDKHPCFTPRRAAPEERIGIDYFSARNVAIPCGWWVSELDQTRIIELVNAWNGA